MNSTTWRDRAFEAVERVSAASGPLRRFVVDRHARAFARVLSRRSDLGPFDRIVVVGGGLFPRTVLVLRRLFPRAELLVVDRQERSLAIARRHLVRLGVPLEGIRFVEGEFPHGPDELRASDLVVLPLALTGDRASVYRTWEGPPLLIHDWIWRRPAGRSGTVISYLFLKRLNLVAPGRAA